MTGAGWIGHTAIIAVSLNLPVVSGLVGVTNFVRDQASIIVDGETGLLVQSADDFDVAELSLDLEETRIVF